MLNDSMVVRKGMAKIRSITHSDILLNFQPISSPPEDLPAFGTQSYVLSGFDKTEMIDLEIPLGRAFRFLYPTLTLPEVARLENLIDENTFLEVLKPYNLKGLQAYGNILSRIRKLDIVYQNFLSEKNFALNELRVLSLIDKNISDKVPRLFRIMTSLHLSKSQAYKAIDLGLELLHIEKDAKWLNRHYRNSDEFMKELVNLRYRNTCESDNEFIRRLKEINWPLHFKTELCRNGDDSFLQIKFPIRSLKDFEKRIRGLVQMNTESLKDLWKHH